MKKKGHPAATLNPETNTMKKTEHEKNKDTQIIIKKGVISLPLILADPDEVALTTLFRFCQSLI